MDWRSIVNKARGEEGEDGVEAGGRGDADVLADGIADIIAEAERGNAAEVGKLRNRVEALEQRVSNLSAPGRQRAAATDAVRGPSEPTEMDLLIDLHGQIEDLRTAMVKLSGRMKALAGE